MSKDCYAAQSYLRNAKGQLERGKSCPCRDANEARREAERMANQRGVAGANAFVIPNFSKEFGGDDPISIAVYGDVPPEARDQLPY